MAAAASSPSPPLPTRAAGVSKTPEQVRWRYGNLAVIEQLPTRIHTMRNFLIATTALAVIGFAGNLKADTVDLALDEMETLTAGSYFHPDPFNFVFRKDGQVRLNKNIQIVARMFVHPDIKGNLADGQAAATAYGRNTFTETLSFADTVEGYMSRSGSHAVAASAPPHYSPYPPKKAY
jgi:homogentisate 1,2-dioxygenase